MSQNTKLMVRQKGGTLTQVHSPMPTIESPDEVIIELKAIAFNPADHKMIYDGSRVTSWPFVPGLDGAGLVVAVGRKVTRLAVGDEVLALFTAGDREAAYQSFAVVKEGRIARKPKSWTFEEAASIGVSYATAMSALGVGLGLPLPFLPSGPESSFRPSSVLVAGGSSALGASTIQLLRLALPHCKILTTSSPKHFMHLRSLGADITLNRSSATPVRDMKASNDGKGVDAIIDAVGAGSSERHIFDAFNSHGPKRYAQVWTGKAEVLVPDSVDNCLFRAADLGRLPWGSEIVPALETLIRDGKYKLPLPVRVMGEGLDHVQKGVEEMRKGASGEKLVVLI